MKSTQATCAAEIKKALKAAFPLVKFSVRSEDFAGGDAVNISWFDGPKESRVNAIVKKYQYGHFDGMTDYYEYSNCIEGLPQVKFVQTSRSMHPDTKAAIMAEMGITAAEWNQNNEKEGEYNCTLAWRKFQQMEFNVEPEAAEEAAPEVEAAEEVAAAPEAYSPQQVAECYHNCAFFTSKQPYFYDCPEQTKIVDWAVAQGFLTRSSHTQIHWTQEGVDWYRGEVFGLVDLDEVQTGKAKKTDCSVSGGCMVCGKEVKGTVKYWVHLSIRIGRMFGAFKYENLKGEELVFDSTAEFIQHHSGKKKRHKWEREGHRFEHLQRCKVCGCTKNSRTIGRTIYQKNGKEFFTAPECD